MKTKLKLNLLLAVITSITAVAQNGPDLLQQALRKEHVDGDLKGAIDLYQQIVKDHPANRALAAQALVQMGKSYEKLGAAEARKAYEKVISDFADQSREVAEARERLKTLDGAAQANGGNGHLLIQKITPEKSDHWDHWVSFGDTRPSPDGRYFGYTNWSHGNLAVCDARTGEVSDLTKDGTWAGPSQFTWGAVWSPDSRQIAFLWIKGDEGDLRIVDRAGGEPRILVPLEKGGSIAPFDWSKDGRFIVGLAPIRKWPDGAKKTMQIVRVDAETGEVEVVRDLPVPSDNVAISLSPDGRHIAYDTKPRGKDREKSSASRIHIVNIDGTSDRLLIDHPAAYHSPRWTPDGKHVVFLSNRSGDGALWAIRVNKGTPTGEPKLIREGLAGSRLLGFADDGTFYYAASTPRTNVFVAEVDFEAGTMQAPSLVSLRHDGKNRGVRWSADGSQLAYLSDRSADSPGGALVFQDFTTGQERDVEVSALNFFSTPFWSPDLTKLVGPAKVPGRENDARALYLVNAQTGQRSMILDKDAACANYTRDGRYLVYLRHNWKESDSVHQLIERELESGAERVITSDQNLGFNIKVLLSPDGTTLAHCSRPYSPTEEHKTSLFVTARDDGKMRSVWEVAVGMATVLDWLPDDRRLLVSVEDEQGTQQLHLIDIESKQGRPFGPALRGNEKLRQVSVHPDGKRIAFSSGGVIEEIWTMRNLLPGENPAAK